MVAFSLEQFFAAFHLGILGILDLEPCRARSRVRRETMLGHDALKIQFAYALKQRDTFAL